MTAAERELVLWCHCGHPRGWHFKAAGSCLECACMTFSDEAAERAADRAYEQAQWRGWDE